MTFELVAPHHASAPLWADKDRAQREVAVAEMAVNFAAFAARVGLAPAPDGNSASPDRFDAQRQDLLSRFDNLLAPARQEFFADLKHAQPGDAAEARDIVAIAELLASYPDFPTAGCEVGHLTGSALIVGLEEQAVLLHRHRKLDRWFQFGGHPDFELDMFSVARREAEEESGIVGLKLLTGYVRRRTPVDVELQHIPGNASRPPHVHADFRYVFAAPHLNPSVGEDESDDFWVLGFRQALTEPDGVIEPSVKRLIAKAEILVTAAREQGDVM